MHKFTDIEHEMSEEILVLTDIWTTSKTVTIQMSTNTEDGQLGRVGGMDG